MTFNTVGGGLVLFLILGTSVYLGFKSRGELGQRLKNWHDSMKLLEELEETRDEDPSEGEDKKQESIVNEEETEKTKEEGEGEGDGISEDVDPGGSEPETDDK
jgi:hypothetical protein